MDSIFSDVMSKKSNTSVVMVNYTYNPSDEIYSFTTDKKQLYFEQLAKENFALWNNALQTKDAKKVAELYSSNLSFLPTVSGKLKTGVNETEKYFEYFLEQNPSPKIIEDKIQFLSDNSYIHSGLYNFDLGKEGFTTILEARFSYVWQKKSSGEWKIIHHHSSVRPK